MYSQNTGDDAGAASFCVSNRMYMRHRRGYNTTNPDKAPTMKLEATQIPAACTYIYGIPSQGKTAVLEHHVLLKVPMLLSIVKMSCSKSTEVRVKHATAIIDCTIKVTYSHQGLVILLMLIEHRNPDPSYGNKVFQDSSGRPCQRPFKSGTPGQVSIDCEEEAQ